MKRCTRCKEEKPYSEFPKNSSEYLCWDCKYATNNEAKLEIRRQALEAYGGKCVCCGETQFEFLSFDHPDGVTDKRHNDFPRWLRRNGYPPIVQVLCHNCNLAKGFYGACPHPNGVRSETGPRSGRPRRDRVETLRSAS